MLLSDLMQPAPALPRLDPDSVRLYRHRFRLAPIDRAELSRLGGAVVVHVEAKDFAPGDSRSDRRPRDLISHEPERLDSDHQRIRRWWQLREEIQHWVLNPRSAPDLLIGATGAPHELWIMGSIRLDSSGWTDTLVQRNRYRMHELPTMGNLSNVSVEMLDWRCLRGRRLGPDVLPQIRFGQPRRGFGQRRGQAFDIVRGPQDQEPEAPSSAPTASAASTASVVSGGPGALPAARPVIVQTFALDTPPAGPTPSESPSAEAFPVHTTLLGHDPADTTSGTAETHDVPETYDVHQTHDVPEARDVLETRDAPEAQAVSETQDIAEMHGASKTHEVADAHEVVETHKVSEPHEVSAPHDVSEPGSIEPDGPQPEHLETDSADLARTESVSAESVSAESVSAESVSAEPNSADSVDAGAGDGGRGEVRAGGLGWPGGWPAPDQLHVTRTDVRHTDVRHTEVRRGTPAVGVTDEVAVKAGSAGAEQAVPAPCEKTEPASAVQAPAAETSGADH